MDTSITVDFSPIISGIASFQRATLAATRQLSATSSALAASPSYFGAIDPAPLISSENLRLVLAALDAESRTTQRTSYALTTADSALAEMNDRLADAEALAIANTNDGLSKEEKAANQMEIDAILSSLDSLAGSTAFAGQSLLDGSAAFTVTDMSITIDAADTASLGATDIDGESYSLSDIAADGTLDTTNHAGAALEVIRAARSDVTRSRGEIGAFITNTVDARLSTLSVTIQTIQSAQSTIVSPSLADASADMVRTLVASETALSAFEHDASNRHYLLDLLRG